MTAKFRLADGGRIDREKTLGFTFNGRRYQGHPGDTLASALLANGVGIIGRSFKYHRPRGIFAAGVEEPNALVQLETGGRALPNHQATRVALYDGLVAESVNCWPSPSIDLMAVIGRFHRILPAGFYYKTFMWPAFAWHFYEGVIRRAAGLGRAPDAADPDRYDKMNAHADVLIVGGGPAGLSAALAAGRAGARVMLADDRGELGGALLGERTEINRKPALQWVAEAERELAAMDDVIILKKTTAFGCYDHNFIGLVEERGASIADSGGGVRQRLWRVRARRTVLATGAIERPLVFCDNDRPGVMLAGAVRAYINRYGVTPGQRVALFTNNDDAYRTAIDLQAAGVEVAAVVDVRPEADGELPTRAVECGIEVVDNSAVTRVLGGRGVSAIEVMTLNAAGDAVGGEPRIIKCDALGSSGGWNPVVHLHCHAGGKVAFEKARGIFIPGTALQAARAAGAANGDFTLNQCLLGGTAAGKAAAHAAGHKKSSRKRMPTAIDIAEEPLRLLWCIPTTKPLGRRGKHFVDLQNDVTADDVQLAAREGYRSIEHAKRYTTLGMATDQGKTGNIPGLAILAGALGQDLPSTGTTTFRPPYTPVTFGALAGRDVGALVDPLRRTPLHHWHARAGARWEDVGQWKRPWYYPREGESMQAAVQRECLATRNAVGIVDASTLGKIDIQGADAAEFLNRIYTNAWNKLAVGRCRYGLMLGEDGMVMDDGVTTRLGDTHFLMTTTTGNAAPVLAWLEEWLQTEWPELRVHCTSVTEAWATIALCGPAARALLSEFTGDINLAADAFPFMSMKEGTVAGIPARIFRISFTGESTFEINVPASYGMGLWTALMNAGERHGITPFGTETMHVLRAEKGYIIVGQDTDGTVTPMDLGMDWIVSKKKDFLGRRSLARSDTMRADRKQLVGLLPEDPNAVLPEGGQITEGRHDKPPMPMIGHVTSSYYSGNLGRSFALALIVGGRQRHGQTVHVPLIEGTLAAQVTEPVFIDPEGNRQHG